MPIPMAAREFPLATGVQMEGNPNSAAADAGFDSVTTPAIKLVSPNI